MQNQSLNSIAATITAAAAVLICVFTMSFSGVLENVVIDRLGFLSLGLSIITGILAGSGMSAEGQPTPPTFLRLVFGISGTVGLGLTAFALMHFALGYSLSIEMLFTATTAGLALLFGFAAGFVVSFAVVGNGVESESVWPAPHTLLETPMVIYSPNEAALSDDGAGFWNDEMGWVTLEDASRYSRERAAHPVVLVSTGGDHRWCDVSDFAPSSCR